MNYDNNKKIVLIFYTLAFTLWLYVIAITNVFYLTPNDFLGILSRLPLFFWASLFLLFIGIKFTYDLCYLPLFYLGVILLIFLLIGTYILVEPNARFFCSYYPSSIASQILEHGKIEEDFSNPGNPYLYYSGFPIFSSVILIVTSLNLNDLTKYFPILLVLLSTFMIISSYKLSMGRKSLIIATCLFITSFWVGQIYFCPQLLAYSLLMILIFLSCKIFSSIHKTEYSLISLITFISIIITHPLTPLMFCAFMFIFILYISIFNLFNLGWESNLADVPKLRNHSLQILINDSIIYIAWLIFIAVYFFENSLENLHTVWSNSDSMFDILISSKLSGISGWNLNRMIVSNTIFFFELFSFVLSFILIIIISINNNKNSLYFIIFKSWYIGGFFLLVSIYGGEVIQRIYMFAIPAMAFLITLGLERHKEILSIILALFVILHPIAFAGDEILKITPDSELEGARFFGNTVQNNSSVWYTHQAYLWYFNPYRAYEPKYIKYLWRTSHISLNESLNKTKYIIYSDIENGMFNYTINYNIKYKIENLSENSYIHKLYNNLMFELYYKGDE